MKQSVIYEVSEILDTFNLEEISKLLNQQIQVEDTMDHTFMKVDHFKPLYYKYRSIMESEENTDEIKQEADVRFMDICNIFLNMICQKFNLTIDEQWKEDHYRDLPGFTMALYSLFILDLTSNILEVCSTYIKENTDYIFKIFEDRKNKKDASTLVNKKIMTVEMAVIIANIYDVTTWILGQLSEDQFLESLHNDYLPLRLIRSLIEEGVLDGQFMIEINDVYATNVALKSDVCFQIVSLEQQSLFNQ